MRLKVGRRRRGVRLFRGTKPPIRRLYGNFNGHGYSAFLAKYGGRGLPPRFISPDNVPAEAEDARVSVCRSSLLSRRGMRRAHNERARITHPRLSASLGFEREFEPLPPPPCSCETPKVPGASDSRSLRIAIRSTLDVTRRDSGATHEIEITTINYRTAR